MSAVQRPSRPLALVSVGWVANRMTQLLAIATALARGCEDSLPAKTAPSCGCEQSLGTASTTTISVATDTDCRRS
jgi:hypothetical protein